MDITSLHTLFLKSTGICTDTRKITKNCLFFALKGAHFNGNEFAEQAVEKGALLAVIDEEKYNQGEKKWLCMDVLSTLQKLATYHRHYLNIPIIALTGSNGKTTTKELIHAIISKKYNCIATKGNLNNHIGVPLTLLSMNKTTEIGIVEMGANHIGEIKALSNITNPDFGYITNFGKAHLEGFGSIEGVIKGKTELYRHLEKNQKKVFINGEDQKQAILSKNIDSITFNSFDSEFKIELLEKTEKLKVSFQNTIIQTQLIGSYNFPNIAAAITIGSYFKVSVEKIKEALEAYVPEMNRSQLIEKENHRIILDAYNANPTSMMAAIDNFKHTTGKNKTLILGDMFELGKAAPIEHENIVNYLTINPFDNVFLIGSNFFNTMATHPSISKFEAFEDFESFIQKKDISEGLILIKGSRGMALERILENL